MIKNVKKILSILLISSISCFASAQDETLSEMTELMFKNTNERNFEALLNMTYPKIYDMVPKETMKNMFVSMFEGTDEMSIDLPKLDPEYTLSETFTDEDSKTDYAFLTYDMSMSMTFKQESFDKEGQDLMVKMFKVQGMDATFETDSKVNVSAPNRMVIFLNNETSNNKWTMLNYDANSPIFVDLLPVGVIEKSKDYHQSIMLEAKKKN
ncbi:hypothetical protein [Winogradskyella haliclonae]|uniref:Uncharacterized protein n=1 Tax=Winogradskyella haliclonae TaxID=2048558 RepID=A0ABQ2C010_9FLAO|nr:hypothetical protein [Winogradskyella haliclonae]GGI57427.1 hypothetical protein GCM10011444_17360 [Winogradskyella haliclonae]